MRDIPVPVYETDLSGAKCQAEFSANGFESQTLLWCHSVVELLARLRSPVGGGPQIAFHDLALEIGDHQVLWFHLLVRDSAGFDDNQVLIARDTPGIAEGIKYRHARNLSQ